MTIVLRGGESGSIGGGQQPLSNSSTQRAANRSSGVGSRFNGNRYRRTANSTIAGTGSSSSSIGGHPLIGADPQKKEIKHRFEITAKLGSGTYGKVSLAFDHKTEREVAVKLIKKSAIENKQDLVRIRREIRIMSMLNHPNLIQIYEVFENKDKIILVMEYASGGELYDYVSKNGSLSEQEARRIFRQITSAVLYCHKNKVAHRDLKLENILLDSNNNAKIADFGLSNYFGQRNKLLSTFCGSPLYASPEIINGTPYKGPEVDCWSLGILLYTLVYGSMPFDGRDFNRMVRQIKRGAYYEPDTPSTASMLIRNMLRVNPDRRATIYDISGHWWLNLEENMPVIQELPENQITDPTPLTERAEIMVVQELADETDVFMEFGHSQTTRKKIEEFRRRRKEAEEYNENSPIKPPKTRKEDEEKLNKNKELLTLEEKSLREIKKEEVKNEEKEEEIKLNNNIFSDPLERLKKLENRLGGGGNKKETSPKLEEENKKLKKEDEEGKEDLIKNNKRKLSTKINLKRKDSVNENIKINEQQQKTSSSTPSTINNKKLNEDPTKYWRLETDSLNALMNQVLEQMEKGPVSLNLIANIRAHPFYDERPEVKELLETIIAAQPVEIQRKASKITKQKSKDVENNLEEKEIKKVGSLKKNNKIIKENEEEEIEIKTVEEKRKSFGKRRRGPAEERRWHSVEVGFSTDSSTEEIGQQQNDNSTPNTPKATVPPPHPPQMSAPKFVGTARISRSEPLGGIDDEEYLEDEDEFYDAAEEEDEFEGEIDELAEEVEQIIGEEIKEEINKKENKTKINNENNKKIVGVVATVKPNIPPKIVEKSALPEPGPSTSKTTDSLERGLAKRVSKGKYQYSDSVELPNQDKKEQFKRNRVWMKSHDPDAESLSAENSSSSAIAPKAEPEEEEEEENNEEEEEEEEEEEDIPFRPKPSTIIGFRTIHPGTDGGIPKEAPIVQVKPQNSQPQSPINKTQNIQQQLPQLPQQQQSPKRESPEPSLRYESAAAYIRRKNRERRARNATVAVTEDTWTRQIFKNIFYLNIF
uniref:Protein kinase domain-containing protein n=1 Tax=Meloidogyne enterolobii TaxID=390850 RepID=A0A6V7TJ40_MELEN|nr:unnamed protein product [Meloidogyne enterolobii]